MEDKNIYIKEKIDFLTENYQELKTKFIPLKKQLDKSFSFISFTHNTIHNCQTLIDRFLFENNLNIKVDVVLYEQRLICIGQTIIDEIVWESLHSRTFNVNENFELLTDK